MASAIYQRGFSFGNEQGKIFSIKKIYLFVLKIVDRENLTFLDH